MTRLLAQANELIDATGRLTEMGTVGILLFFLVAIIFGLGITVRYLMKRLFDEEKGILTLWVQDHIAVMKNLQINVSENVNTTKKIDSHVVKITAALSQSSDDIRKFRIVWRRYVRVLRVSAETHGFLDKVKAELDYIDRILDGHDDRQVRDSSE